MGIVYCIYALLCLILNHSNLAMFGNFLSVLIVWHSDVVFLLVFITSTLLAFALSWISDKLFYLNFISLTIENINDAVIIACPQKGNLLYVNKTAMDILSLNHKDISEKKYFEIDAVASKTSWDKYLNNLERTGTAIYESSIVRKDKRTIPVEVNVKYFKKGKRSCLIAVLRELTERNKAKELHQLIVHTTSDGFCLMDRAGHILEVNKALAEMASHNQDEMIGKAIYDLLDFREDSPEKIQRILLIGSGSLDCHMGRGNREPLFVNAIIRPIPGDSERLFAFFRNLDERRRMEMALGAEKRRLAVTLRSIVDGVIATDTQGKVVLMNPAAENITGWSIKEAQGLPVAAIFHLLSEKTGLRLKNPVDLVLSSGRSIKIPRDAVLIANDGTRRLLAYSSSPIMNEHEELLGAVLIVQDKSLERKTEREIQKVEKLTSLSLLAGGIAHDFNNFLAAILGNIGLAKLFGAGQEELLVALCQAEEAGLRAKDLAGQLLTFAKGGSPHKKFANIAEIIDQCARFTTAGSMVKCEVVCSPNLWRTKIDSNQISQVIQNLIINGMQAMPQGGTIKVCAQNFIIDKEDEMPLKPGNYVKIDVQDEGLGIWPDDLPYIFDPFFTTKDNGSGLGLTTSYSIIKKHDGLISADSVMGQGSTFTIFLPAKPGKLASIKKNALELKRGNAKVLIMDDNKMVRNNLGMLLKSLGYKTGFASDGEEALKIFTQAQKTGEPYEVVITDLTIPGGVGGKETMQQLLTIDPAVRGIVISGYSNDGIMRSFKELGYKGAIKKPYQIHEVSNTLYQVLNASASSTN